MTPRASVDPVRRTWSVPQAAAVASIPFVGVYGCAWLALREVPSNVAWTVVAFVLFGASPAIAAWAAARAGRSRAVLVLAALVAVALIAVAWRMAMPATTRPGLFMGPTVFGIGLVMIVVVPVGWYQAARRAGRQLEFRGPWWSVWSGAAGAAVVLAVGFAAAAFTPL